MKVVKPRSVNSDSVLTSSSIAEPDLTMGEVEWVDRSTPSIVGSSIGQVRASILASNGFIYYTADIGAVARVYKFNPVDYSSLLITEATTTGLESISSVDGIVIYCLGNETIIKIDTSTDTASNVLGGDDSILGSSASAEGNIYGVGLSTQVLKLIVATDTVSLFGALTVKYRAMSTGTDGHLYCVGDEGDILRIDSESDDLSYFGSYTGTYRTSILASDGFIYAAGESGYIMQINTLTKVSSLVYEDSGSYYASCLMSDREILFVGNKKMMIFDTKSQTGLMVGDFLSSNIIRAATQVDGFYCYTMGVDVDVNQVTPKYAEDEQVIKTTSHRLYQAATNTYDDPEIGVLSVPPTWVDISATNKYKAFDDVVSSLSSSETGEMVMTIKPGQLFDSIAGLNLSGIISVTVSMNDPSDGEVYNKTITMNNEEGVIDWYSYLFTEITQSTTFAVLDMPPYASASVTITMNGGGNVAAGVITVGKSYDLGVTNYNTGAQLLDFSRVDEDSFGNIVVEKRTPAKLVNFSVSAESKGKLDYVFNQLNALVGVISLYIGEESDPKNMTTAYGIHRNVTLTKETPTLNTYTLQVRGLI